MWSNGQPETSTPTTFLPTVMLASVSVKRGVQLRARALPVIRAHVPLAALARQPFHTTPLRAEDAKTGLYDFHVQQGAKMVPFGGFSMPLTYDGVGQVASHKHVREHAGLFDVGHMVQHMYVGELTPGSRARRRPLSCST